MSVAMALFELLQLFLIFLDHPRIEYLWHVPIMPPINQKGIRCGRRQAERVLASSPPSSPNACGGCDACSTTRSCAPPPISSPDEPFSRGRSSADAHRPIAERLCSFWD